MRDGSDLHAKQTLECLCDRLGLVLPQGHFCVHLTLAIFLFHPIEVHNLDRAVQIPKKQRNMRAQSPCPNDNNHTIPIAGTGAIEVFPFHFLFFCSRAIASIALNPRIRFLISSTAHQPESRFLETSPPTVPLPLSRKAFSRSYAI